MRGPSAKEALAVAAAIGAGVEAATPQAVLGQVSEVGLIPEGSTQLFVPIDADQMVFIRTQYAELGGNVYSVDTQNNPSSMIVIGMVGDRNRRVIVPLKVAANMATGVVFQHFEEDSHDGRIAVLEEGSRAQVARSQTPGECGFPDGCSEVRTVQFYIAADGSLEPLGDSSIVSAQAVSEQPRAAEVAQAPRYPQSVAEVINWFGGNADQWKRVGDSWNFNSDTEVDITPAGFIMDGYNKQGPFVAGGTVTIRARGATVWDAKGEEEARNLQRAVESRLPGVQVRLVLQ